MNSAKRVFSTILLLSFLIVPTQNADQNISYLFEKICLGLEHHVPGDIPIVKADFHRVQEEKEWTIILYVSADNDLAPFSIRNIKQMAEVGSNEHFNIVVQLDIRKSNGKKITRRYFVKKGKVLHLNADDPDSQAMDSGDPETLVSCCKWAITEFPAKNYGLVLWNHGAGILDPSRYRAIRAEELFVFNPRTQRLEIDRSLGYLERMLHRGICFDDSTGNYLTNQDLEYALETIYTKYLDEEKFAFVGFDACLMQMVEVANLFKDYACVIIGSQEASLGYGWNYADMFRQFEDGAPDLEELMRHMVKTYKKTYEPITDDYTLSAICLNKIEDLEENLHEVAALLLNGLKKQRNGAVKKAVRASRSRLICTHFDEPSYIDLYHFYGNLLRHIEYMKLLDDRDEELFQSDLEDLLIGGRDLIEEIVFANTVGESLARARGISIYFPERGIHSSYGKTLFAKENAWMQFLIQYLSS